MPRKVPTSAAATWWPISATSPPMAAMVMTMPSTAATMPKPGRESASTCSACAGSTASWWWVSTSISSSCSSSWGSMLPLTISRRQSVVNSIRWWSASSLGYLENTGLDPGLSMSFSIPIMPSLRALTSTS